jgi:hypothetical protein
MSEKARLLAELVKEGQVVGVDPLSEADQTEKLLELVELYQTDRIAYGRKRHEYQAMFGAGVTKDQIEAEVKKLIEQNAPPQLAGPESAPVVDELVAIAKTEATLWHDTKRAGYATFRRDGHIENHRLVGDDFEHWLSDKFGELHKREINGELCPCFPKRQDLKEALFQITGYARLGDERRPRIRVTEHSGELWIDLGTADWSCVRVSADGWRIEPRMSVPLVRGVGMRALPIPERGGNIRDLRPFVNVRGDDDFVLLCGSMASLLNPFGQFMTYLLCGPPGSAKTTITRAMRALTDPHEVDSRRPGSVRDIYHATTQTHVVAFENMRHVNEELSDAICALNTGTGYGERLYYNQGKEFQLRALCPVIINGIPTNIADQSDLLARSVNFRFDYLGDRVRSEEALRNKFEAAAPRLFGALLDGLVGAMRARREFGDNDAAAVALLGESMRFADVAIWAEAACRAMGFAPREYATALRSTKDVALRELAEFDSICVGVRKLIIAKNGAWQGGPAELCAAIQPYVRQPVYPNWITRDLPPLIPVLHKICRISVLMHQFLKVNKQNDNGNGIVIRYAGTHFSGIVGASGRGQPETDMQSNKSETTVQPNKPETHVQSGSGRLRRL